ncbi:ABC transporter permease subunit [Pluralibacter gergoviae]|uniref:ABC transporter permease subunit n=1 Tax=Pluralibacter gergoviae TaxID=61647 RepID=UPI0027EFAD5F|nr:ABC transporter permease subunit [Pluralibacter gergoviae]EKZ9516535.1 ABC transporter permease subunit [Pluralibacter gergoviae]ELC3018749.1 ABC transporter permease subunit [Pluralibacter gergoviae]ELC3023874.1 ABC transporter permease subunit [Pluralibacter gergoviae]ELG9929771.1 ABC transporter permease subunit [Pluralibacter gergoviae]ELK5592131.1 ABC transporter permease subunit [Pluralibacter gergoviae]
MLIWSRKAHAVLGGLAIVLGSLFFLLPLAVILLSGLTKQWSGTLPTGFTLIHIVNAFRGAAWDALFASLVVGFCASLLALLCGVWAALALRGATARVQKALGLLFYLPSAIPSVSVGLGVLVAFSQGPLQMNGTFAIVLVVHFILISAFTFSSVATGLGRISPDIENVASSLGASPGFRLWHVTLPMLMPWLLAALALSLSLSMGELGATIMIYPPGWTTLPVAIFSLTDRGNIADGSAMTLVLVALTLLLMIALEKMAGRLARK